MITLHNTKSRAVDGVKIIDQFPISEDSQIQVKHVAPLLNAAGSSSTNSVDSARKAVTVAKGVVAMWDGAEDKDTDVESLGNNGKLNWICSIPPQGKVNLTLQWEVAGPEKTDISGLDI
jgi:hypothetical protein